MGGPLKYYTSEVPAARTISRIEEVLSGSGASHILKEYSNGEIVAMSFRAKLPDSREAGFRLPANVNAVYKILAEDRAARTFTQQEKLKEQSRRTAWRLMQDWVEVQFALIKMNQAEFLQVFLPYVWNGTETFYESAKRNGFKMLPLPREESWPREES